MMFIQILATCYKPLLRVHPTGAGIGVGVLARELAMPRYFFDLTDAKGSHSDVIGEDLSDVEEARTQCQGILPDIIREDLPNSDLHTIACDVRDESGRIVYRGEITFRGMRDPEDD